MDWVALSGKVTSDAGKAELNSLRAAYADVVKTVDAAPSTTPTVDWAKWSATIKTPGIVDEFKAAYEKLSVPQLEDTFTADVNSTFESAIAAAEVHAAASTTRIVELEAMLVEVENRKDWTEVTVDEELAKNPEIAAEIEEEIESNKW